MYTIKQAMESYVSFLERFADPFGVGVSVHLLIFMINWLIIYALVKILFRHRSTDTAKIIHDRAGIVSFVLGYLFTVAFIWIKNN